MLSDFVHIYQPAPKPSTTTLLLLHGTGGNEQSLLDVGRELAPHANLLSPRGRVLEGSMPRFFRRISEGVFDEHDIKIRAAELAAFLTAAAAHYKFTDSNIIAVGFSNGANIAAALMLLHPQSLRAAALWRAMVPLVPPQTPDLKGKSVLITSGEYDGMVTPLNRQQLASLFKSAGAKVQTELLPVGHNLTQNDLAKTGRWLKDL